MPAIVGAINVNSVGGVFNIGDVGTIAPSSFFKTYAGGGSFNSGETLNVNNSPSVINIYGSDAYEQNIIVPGSDGSDQSNGSNQSDSSDQEDNQP